MMWYSVIICPLIKEYVVCCALFFLTLTVLLLPLSLSSAFMRVGHTWSFVPIQAMSLPPLPSNPWYLGHCRPSQVWFHTVVLLSQCSSSHHLLRCHESWVVSKCREVGGKGKEWSGTRLSFIFGCHQRYVPIVFSLTNTSVPLSVSHPLYLSIYLSIYLSRSFSLSFSCYFFLCSSPTSFAFLHVYSLSLTLHNHSRPRVSK